MVDVFPFFYYAKRQLFSRRLSHLDRPLVSIIPAIASIEARDTPQFRRIFAEKW